MGAELKKYRSALAACLPPLLVFAAGSRHLPASLKQHNILQISKCKKSRSTDNRRYSSVVEHFTCNEKAPCSTHGDGLTSLFYAL